MVKRANAWWHRAPPLPRPSDPLIDRLWRAFAADVPAAATFAHLASWFAADHLTLRTVARPGSGLPLFTGVFERRGWRATLEHAMADEPVRAVQLSREGLPRIVVLELDPTRLPADAHAALLRLPADAPPPDDDDALAAWFKAPLPPSGADLDLLEQVSPFGAWLLAFGRRVHHLAVSVADLDEWCRRLSWYGVALDGDVEGAPDAPLRRVATVPTDVEVLLRDGTSRRMPCRHLELVERRPGYDSFLVATTASQALEGKRRHPRVAAALHVDLGYGGLRVPVVSENVSLGGMFLQLSDEDAPAAYSTLQLTIELPGGPIAALATVIYQVPGRGVGVEFQWWDDESIAERQALAAHLRSLV
ncbi:MAG: DUF1338 family protein [Deltaproteobacteria bacterium]|nr:DUF1338 family protein [Deltaproteobacteria bacterium]